jgi:hypothetical protein
MHSIHNILIEWPTNEAYTTLFRRPTNLKPLHGGGGKYCKESFLFRIYEKLLAKITFHFNFHIILGAFCEIDAKTKAKKMFRPGFHVRSKVKTLELNARGEVASEFISISSKVHLANCSWCYSVIDFKRP